MIKKASLLLSAALFCASLSGGVWGSGQTVSAVTAADWRAGRIIDDSIFTNKNSMNVEQIQAFLNSKVGTGGYDSVPGQCDSNGVRNAQPFSSSSRADYAASLGRPRKFTCLNTYYEVPKTSPGPGVPASNYGGAAIPAGAKSAAQLIWDAAQRHNISPKVLLVTIQKESIGPLTIDDWPFQNQYTYAMGAHCPDSGPGGSANCDPDYAGFSIQISESAALMRWYLDNMDEPWWSYKKLGNNSIQYHPNTACNSSNVYIQTMATAALYTYTPYQPNQEALDHMYTTGNSCSSYGNRNFWRIYNDWFGSTIADYKWSNAGYKVLDATESAYMDPGRLEPGQKYIAKLHAINTGDSTWLRNGPAPVLLGTSNPTGRSSILCDSSWVACNRPVELQETSVTPGQLGHFKFTFRAPYKPGDYREYFKPVAEMLSWTNDSSEPLGIRVIDPGSYKWSNAGYKVLNEAETQYLDPGNLRPNTKYIAKLHAINTGSATWKRSSATPVLLGTSNPTGRSSAICNTSWIACHRPVALQEESVAPGQLGHFKFVFKTPSSTGTYREYFKPVAEMYSWMNDSAEPLGIIVRN